MTQDFQNMLCLLKEVLPLERATSGSNVSYLRSTDFLVNHLIASGADVTDSGVTGILEL